MYPVLINNLSQVLDHVHAKRAFFQVGIQLVLSQSAQNLLNMPHVLFPRSDEDKDVIQIYHHKGVGEGSKYIIHQPHESGCCILNPKRMTSHSWRPCLDLKVVFHTSVGSMGTW
jgi:hypothetical protein